MPSRAIMNRLFVESSSSSSGSGGCGREAEPGAAVLCAPRPRRVQVHPCSADLILGVPPFLLTNNKSKEGGKTKAPREADEAGGWALFGGSPPARADNPLVHDPHFLLNQRLHPVEPASPSPLELGIFDHQSPRRYSHRGPTPTYISSNSSSNSSFAPSFAPAVRIQGFDVGACRSSHNSNGGGRVLSARA